MRQVLHAERKGREIHPPVYPYIGAYWFDLKISQLLGTYEFPMRSNTRVVKDLSVQEIQPTRLLPNQVPMPLLVALLHGC